ncbi:MAG: GIY-YIG nuclease family protein [Bacteroidales bacterium]|nr:GIY-YIG nuclease family protein [Bacteroidales bacterium]
MYILQCSDGTYYTGSTKDLDRRIRQHNAGEASTGLEKNVSKESI